MTSHNTIDFICNLRFHCSFTLPRAPPFRVTYADFGDSTSDAVVLLCGGLMTSRFCYSPLDQLAKAHNVRIIHPDRPGIGGTCEVPVNERITLWLEMVPQLLAHLKIPYISLASHSGGDIYALATMTTYPNLLHPTNPYAMFFAPWVHPLYSGVSAMRAAELLPAPVLGNYGNIVRFLNEKLFPVKDKGDSISYRIKYLFQHSPPPPAPVPLIPTKFNISRSSASLGLISPSEIELDNHIVVEELRSLIITYLYAESMDGVSGDAQLFLRHPNSKGWSEPAADIGYAVPLLLKLIKEDSRTRDGKRTWTFDAFHAETDKMVGKKGQIWFDDLWRTEEGIEYRSRVLEWTDHNYIMDPAFGASAEWLRRVRNSFPQKKEPDHVVRKAATKRPLPLKALSKRIKRTIGFGIPSTGVDLSADLESSGKDSGFPSSTVGLHKGIKGRRSWRNLHSLQ